MSLHYDYDYCEVASLEDCYEGAEAYATCKKHPGHKQFMSVDKVKEKLFADDNLNQDIFDNYLLMIDRTCKVNVSYTSMERPEQFPHFSAPYPFAKLKGTSKERSGTGFLLPNDIRRRERRCSCHRCETSEEVAEKFYWEIFVATATHVVFDQSEAKCALLELFYDSEDKKDVEYIYGVDLWDHGPDRLESDYCVMRCVTHDEKLANRLRPLLHRLRLQAARNNYCLYGVLVSHPHGMSKKISNGIIGKLSADPQEFMFIFTDIFLQSWDKFNDGDKCCDDAVDNPDSGLLNTLWRTERFHFHPQLPANFFQSFTLMTHHYPWFVNPVFVLFPLSSEWRRIADILQRSRIDSWTESIALKLTNDLVAVLEESSKFSKRYQKVGKGMVFCGTISTETKLISMKHGKVVDTVKGLLFHAPSEKTYSGGKLCCLVHTIPTCPGSSGALVYTEERHGGNELSMYNFAHHQGAFSGSLQHAPAPEGSSSQDALVHQGFTGRIYVESRSPFWDVHQFILRNMNAYRVDPRIMEMARVLAELSDSITRDYNTDLDIALQHLEIPGFTTRIPGYKRTFINILSTAVTLSIAGTWWLLNQ